VLGVIFFHYAFEVLAYHLDGSLFRFESTSEDRNFYELNHEVVEPESLSLNFVRQVVKVNYEAEEVCVDHRLQLLIEFGEEVSGVKLLYLWLELSYSDIDNVFIVTEVCVQIEGGLL